MATAVALFGWIAPRAASAQVTIEKEPARPTLFYSQSSQQDCSQLFADAETNVDLLPYHVVRLRAVPPAGVDPDSVRYQWSLPKPQQGFLLAYQDLGPQETSAAVRGLCGEFGNACLLTKESLRFYDLDTVLYAAPTCDVLPTKTDRPFDGGAVKIKVVVKEGKKKLGKAIATVVYGDRSVASVVLYSDGKDGHGDSAVSGGTVMDFNAIETPPDLPGFPAIDSFEFTSPIGSATEATCPDLPADVCVELGSPNPPPTYLARVDVNLDDGSALCDNLNVRVGSCEGDPQIQVIRVPSKRTYVSDDDVDLRVRLANLSPEEGGCVLRLRGANVLTCEATFKLGATEETKRTTWELRHCSVTTDESCSANNECPPGEICLLQSHCSETITQLCTADSECEPGTDEGQCPDCQEDERCVRVLEQEEMSVPIGEAIDLVVESVTMKNTIKTPVAVRETWTVNTFGQGSDDETIKYRIRGD